MYHTRAHFMIMWLCVRVSGERRRAYQPRGMQFQLLITWDAASQTANAWIRLAPAPSGLIG